jgi:hypothetical protein
MADWDTVLEVGLALPDVRADPEVFFTLPHYEGAPYVLVRLAAVSRETLQELLEDARTLALD